MSVDACCKGPETSLDQTPCLDPSTLGGGGGTISNMRSIVKRESGRRSERTSGPAAVGAEPREEAERSGQAIRRSYTRGTMAKRIRFRPPGLKPTTKVGTLGPYRGRLGFAWVIAPVFAGIAIVLAGWLLLR